MEFIDNNSLEVEARIRAIFEEDTVGHAYFAGPDIRIQHINAAMLKYWGKDENIIGKTFREALPELETQIFPSLLDQVFASGKAYQGVEVMTELLIKDQLTRSYFNFTYKPYCNPEGQVLGIHHIAIDVTEQVVARHRVEESVHRARSIVESAPFPIGVYTGPEMKIELANDAMLNVWGKGPGVIGKLYTEILPELKGSPIFDQVLGVYQTGFAYQSENQQFSLLIHGRTRIFYFNYQFTPLFDLEGKVYGVMNTAADVTDLNLNKQKAEESERNLRNIILQSPVAMCIFMGPQHIVEIANDRMIDLWGKTADSVLQRPLAQGIPEAREQGLETLLNQVYTTGQTFRAFGKPILLLKEGQLETTYINFVYEPFYHSKDKIAGVMAVAIDITQETLARNKIEESESRFRLLADAMPQFIWTGDPSGNLNYFNKAIFDFSGLSIEKMQQSGWLEIVHPDEQEENVRKWIEAVATGKDFLFEHRFRRHDGEYRWQLSRALPQRDNEGNIQLWVGTSTDIQDQKMFLQHLESLVQERTREIGQKNRDLEKINAELHSFAYVASHDLQEPLRKIQTFASRILEKDYDVLSAQSKYGFERMLVSADRMRKLIQDLLTYSEEDKQDRPFEISDLALLAEEVKENLQEELKRKGADLRIGPMCQAKVIPFQIIQLLNNLIGNSLKFSNPAVAGKIDISAILMNGENEEYFSLTGGKKYCQLVVEDNGIGFQPEHNEKIFDVFHRLHSKELYEGTGVGLAIVKKIALNHHGFIVAKGTPGVGASFAFYIPQD